MTYYHPLTITWKCFHYHFYIQMNEDKKNTSNKTRTVPLRHSPISSIYWHSWRICRSSTFVLNRSYLQSHTILRDSLDSLTCITLHADLVAAKQSTLVVLLNDVLSPGRQGHRTISLQKELPTLPQPHCTAVTGAAHSKSCRAFFTHVAPRCDFFLE